MNPKVAGPKLTCYHCKNKIRRKYKVIIKNKPVFWRLHKKYQFPKVFLCCSKKCKDAVEEVIK